MSKIRGLVPVLLATGLGVLNGYIIFTPAYQDLEAKKLEKQQLSQANDLGPDLKDVPIAGPGSTSTGDAPTLTWTRKIHGWYTGTPVTSSPATTAASNKNDETKGN